MRNLLNETLSAIRDSDHAVEDVKFIGSNDGKYRCTWEEFQEIADFEYDSGFGAQKVAADLVIMFFDKMMMSRFEYDGSERWEFNAPTNIDLCPKPIKHLNVADIDAVGWRTVEDLNAPIQS